MSFFKVPIISKFEWQKAVLDILSSPPASPVKGERYIIGPNAIGSWIGKNNQLAEFTGIEWDFLVPFQGMIIYVVNYDRLFQYTNLWEDLISIGREIVESYNFNRTLSINDFGKTFTCQSADPVIFYLPSVTISHVGNWFRFVKLGSGILTVEAANDDKISDSGPGDTIYNDTPSQVWATLTIMLAKEKQWVINSGHGTWITTTSQG